MSRITIMSKQPPGGRCPPQMRYAETLRQRLGFDAEVRYCDDGADVPAPAMLIEDVLTAASDRVILTPEDIADFNALAGRNAHQAYLQSEAAAFE